MGQVNVSLTPMDSIAKNPELLKQYLKDPYPLHEMVRRQRLIQDSQGIWYVGRYQDVDAILKDRRFGKQPLPGTEHRMPASAADDNDRRSMLVIDPPDHGRIRGRFAKAFNARRIEAMRPHIQALVDGLLDHIEPRGRMEVMREYAHLIPSTIISEMLGIPAADRARFARMSNDLIETGTGIDPGTSGAEKRRRNEQVTAQFDAFLTELFEEKRQAPGDDLTSGLLLRNEEEENLSHLELTHNVRLLFMAGHETTVNLIGNALIALARHPAQLEKLRQRPELMPRAVEEFLRFDSSVQQLPRVAQADVEIDGHHILAGQMVVLLLGSANRDGEVYENAQALDIERPFRRSKSFGGGAHFCLGAQLARIETEIALGRLLDRIPHFEIDDLDSLDYPFNLFFRGPKALHVSWSSSGVSARVCDSDE